MAINTISATHGPVNQSARTEQVTFKGRATGSGAFSPTQDRDYRVGFDYEVGNNFTAPPFDSEGPILLSDGSFGFFTVTICIPSSAWGEDFEWVPGLSYSGFLTVSELAADRGHVFRARGTLYVCDTGDFIATHTGGQLAFKTDAVNLTFSGSPSTSGVTNSQATLSQSFFPNTNESTATALFQYRVLGGSTWTETAGQVYSGYSVQTRQVTVTGLVGSTTYEYRLRVTRTTNNGTDNFGTIGTFTTSPDAPTITTVAASGVGHDSATLNGTSNPNSISVRVRFGWGTSDGGATPGSWANLTAYQNLTGSTEKAFLQALAGLSASTTYFFRAFVEWPSPGFANGASGSTLSFTTGADPGETARRQSSPRMERFRAQYGVARTLYFSLDVPVSVNPDVFASGAFAFEAGDVRISKDGAAFANATNLPVHVGEKLYSLDLTPAETAATDVLVMIHDDVFAIVPICQDLHLRVETRQRVGQLDLDYSGVGGSASAIRAKASAGGNSFEGVAPSASEVPRVKGYLESMVLRVGIAQGGAAGTITLDSGASSSNDFYNGAVVVVVAGTGAGQARLVKDYTGASRIADVNRSWVVNPDSTSVFVLMPGAEMWDTTYAGITGASTTTELSAAVAPGGDGGDKLQQCFQRFAFQHDRSATTIQLYKSDAVFHSQLPTGTVYASTSVSFDGSKEDIDRFVS